jgi:integrase
MLTGLTAEVASIMPRKMSDKGVAALKSRASRYSKPDPELRGLWIRVQPSGNKSFWAVTRNPDGKQVWTFIGPTDGMSIEAAREEARTILSRVRAGLPAVEPKGETFGAVADGWLRRYVDSNGLRTKDKIIYLLDRHVDADFRAREFIAIRRSDVTRLLDEIEDDHGGPTADFVLSIIRRIMTWYATRHDDYVPPLVRGMGRTKPKERARKRIFDDDEIRAVWTVAGESGTYGALVRMLLLTAQRLDKVITMKWTDISPMQWPGNEPPVWELPTAPREKGNIGAVRLRQAVLDILDTLPRFADNPYVFAGRGSGHLSYSGRHKAAFDAKLPAGMPAFVLHDLRRTARSLMSRAGVRPDIAERVMGHAIKGVQGIYDRFEYADEKADALAKLANLIDGIIHPRANMLPMATGKRRR